MFAIVSHQIQYSEFLKAIQSQALHVHRMLSQSRDNKSIFTALGMDMNALEQEAEEEGDSPNVMKIEGGEEGAEKVGKEEEDVSAEVSSPNNAGDLLVESPSE